MTFVERAIREYPELWEQSGKQPEVFLGWLADAGLMAWADVPYYVQEYYYIPPEVPPELVEPEKPRWGLITVTPTLQERAQQEIVPLREAVRRAVGKITIEYFDAAFHQAIESFWVWFRQEGLPWMRDIWKEIEPTVSKYWGKAKDAFVSHTRWLGEQTDSMVRQLGVVRPEDAPTVAAQMWEIAMGFGAMAHFTAVGLELLHPFKELGFGQLAGALSQLAAFGPVSAATLGVMHFHALRRPMDYYMANITRSQLPDERLLQIMAVKPDITLEQFRQGMAYLGYRDEWIAAVERTMYHEPRYFELKMMSEDEAASEDWLFLKSRRAGFTEQDSKIMVSSYLKTATRTQRLDYYRQGFYLYKEGYISKEEFGRMLDELELRPEAKVFCMRAAELAYLNDYIRDMISYYNDSFQKDLIDEDELLVSLVGLGVISDRAWLLTAKAKVKKRPKPTRAVDVTVKKALTEIQKKYITLYVTQYRKDLIDEAQLLESLLAIGLELDLAEVTVAIEAAKKGVVLASY